MKVKLDGVGILPDCEMDLDGLTVISGINGTGKSTVLKALYTILDPSTDIESRKEEEILGTIRPIVRRLDGGIPKQHQDDVGELIRMLENFDNIKADDREALDVAIALYKGRLGHEFHMKLLERDISAEFGSTEQFVNLSGDHARVSLDIDGVDHGLTVDHGDVSWTGPYDDLPGVVYYDDPFVLEDGYSSSFHPNHRMRLSASLYDVRAGTVIDDIASDIILKRFDESVREIVPGTIHLDRSKRNLVYDEPGRKPMDIRNLATGMKIFSIIRMMIEKGLVSKGTVLLLDEPEIHLHPRWINILADVIRILVAEMGVMVVMTTHNPQLLMAMESIAVDLPDMCRFYDLSHGEDGIVFADVTGDLQPVYREMAEPLIQVSSRFLEE